jgi:primosomal protein N' (replication factor Y)
MKYADVYVGYPVEGSFTYAVPEGVSVLPGTRVGVDFNNRPALAFVHRVHSEPPAGIEIKSISGVVDTEPIFDSRLLDLCSYVADNYFCTMGEALAMALPSGRSASARFKHPSAPPAGSGRTLTEEQRAVFENIAQSGDGRTGGHLIFGITGSGKTEIYMELAERLIRENRSVIYLVPEISLSSQIFTRLHAVFGEELIVYHSQLTPQQRLHSWLRFYRGESRIAVGTRSAVFLQCPGLGLIVVDEEHDPSYKEHSTPRYNARRIALYRSRKEGALLVMGSATPSIESLYSAERGMLRLHVLKGRFGEAALPPVEVVRIRPGKPAELLSSILKLHSKRALDDGRQVIYLLNRRGFAPFVLCESCGDVPGCPRCSVGLNFHRDGSLLCHLCGYRRRMPENCGKCGSDGLVRVGSGTQRIEDLVGSTFPASRIFRLDQDSSRKKGTGFRMVEMMNRGEVDILLGTQMVAKGFDFHNVALVGVILADIGINLPDFRAPERIFSLLLQVAGRCGRGAVPGRVIVQTFNDDHYIFSFLKSHDYHGFYRHELEMRKAMDYPPFSRLVRLLARGAREERVSGAIEAVGLRLKELIEREGLKATLLGPSQAPLGKIARNFRYHLILKSHSLEDLRRLARAARESALPGGVYLEMDVDPVDML